MSDNVFRVGGLTFRHDSLDTRRKEWTVYRHSVVGDIFLYAQMDQSRQMVTSFCWQAYTTNGTRHGEEKTFEAARTAICRVAAGGGDAP